MLAHLAIKVVVMGTSRMEIIIIGGGVWISSNNEKFYAQIIKVKVVLVAAVVPPLQVSQDMD